MQSAVTGLQKVGRNATFSNVFSPFARVTRTAIKTCLLGLFFLLGSASFFTAAGGTGAFIPSGDANVLVVMEAENHDGNTAQGIRSWVEVFAPAGFSGTSAFQAQPVCCENITTGYATLSPRLDYRVNFNQPGTYYVWVRGWADSGSDDSLHVGLDGVETASGEWIDLTEGAGWHWIGLRGTGVVATLEVATAGEHTINVWMREDGTYFDKLLLTANAAYVPTGAEPESARDTGGANQAPVAAAGGPYSGTAGTAILFDGSGSFDGNGDTLSYSWDFGDGTALGTGVAPTHTYTSAGTFTVTLTVSDGMVTSPPSTATATVASSNQPPVANAGSAYSGLVDKVISFSGAGSSDADGDPLSYSWDFGDGSTPHAGVSPSHAYTTAGTYTATLIVNDGTVSSAASTVSVTISAVAEPSLIAVGGVERVQQAAYTVTGFAQPGQTVNLYANDVRVATLAADGQGNYQTGLTLQAGLNSLYAKTVSGGVESQASNLETVFYETQASSSQVVGSISGALGVSDNGAATYSISIQMPPAISGVQPAISLEYNSQSGNGLLGIGWSIGGISAISRCPTTLERDGFIDGIDFDTNDRYCLDGQRITQVANTGCAGGSEYRTEIETYSRICSYGVQGSGPTYFTVQTKSGEFMEYGNSSNSRIEAQGRSDVLVWSVNKVKDTLGNSYSLIYTEDNAAGQYYVDRIDYNSTDGGSTYNATIQFSYESRPDPITGYLSGSKVSTNVRLKQIATFLSGAQVSRYDLAYLPAGSADRSRLSQVTECGFDGSCKSPTVFNWKTGVTRLVDKGAWVSGAYANWASLTGRTRIMDVNGDSLSDIVLGPDANGKWYVLRNTGSGFVDEGAWITGAYGDWDERPNRIRPMDVNGDGLTDIVLGPDANGNWFVLRSTGSSFVAEGAWITGAYGGWNNSYQRIRVMDANGDGLTDVVLGPNANGQWFVLRNTGSSFVDEGAWITGAYGDWDGRPNRIRVIDANGDTLPDIVLGPDANGNWFVLRSTGSSFVDEGAWITGAYGGWNNSYQRVRAMDANGDGLQDIVIGPNSGGSWFVMRNTGSSFVDEGAWITGAYGDWDERPNRILVMDVNADELLDIVLGPDANGNWFMLRNSGTSFSNAGTLITSAYGNWNNSAKRIGALDTDGDSLSDIILGPDTAGKWYVLQPDSARRALIENITDGLGVSTDITYTSLTDNSIYQKNSDASYPVTDIQLAMYVVSQLDSSDGIGGTRTTSYKYKGLKYHLRGLGFLGFREIEKIDSATNIVTTSTYNQVFPLTGNIEYTDTRIVGAADPVSTNALTWDVLPLDGGARFEVRAAATTAASYELDGSLVSTIDTQYSNYDSFGNAGKVSVATTGGGKTFTKVTDSTYDNDTSRWLLGRLRTATVTSTLPDATVGVRHSSFVYDTNTGLLTTEYIEQGNANLELRTDYTYDTYGNKTSATVRDSGSAAYPISARTSHSSYDYSNLPVNGTYTVVATNAITPVGHSETRVVDARFGVAKTLTGPNGLTTRWQYDGFGRKTEEVRADGGSTVWEYDWCSGDCPTYGVYKVSEYSTGAPPATAYYDGLTRVIRSQTVGLTGRSILSDTGYDNRGQVVSATRNYFAGDPSYATTTLYDDLGRVTQVNSPDGGIVKTAYAGLTTSIRKYDPNGDYDQTITRIQNAIGEEIEVRDEANQPLYKQYDPFGNLLQTTDPAGNVVAMAYDARGRKIAMDDPDMGHWEYAYDALGQLRWQKNAKNQIVTLQYDVLGRMVQRDEAEGRTTWIYDTAVKGIGKLAGVIAPEFQRSLSYDSLGRLTGDSRTLDGASLTMGTRYDALGRTERLVYPSGFQVAQSYNSNGYPAKVYNAASAADVFWEASDSDADGNVVTFTLAGHIQTDRLYDPLSGRLTGIVTGNNIQLLNYAYDSLGNLKQRVDQYQGLTENFYYEDNRNRLTRSEIVGYGTKLYTYDNLGNITRKGTVSNYVYPTNGTRPHAVTLAGGNAYSYDANGSMVSGAGRTIQWTSYNKPDLISKSGASVAFDYGPDRARFRQIKNSGGVTTTTLYFDKLFEQVSKSGGTESKHYIIAGGSTVAIYNHFANGNENVRYLHHDHLGSTDAITDELGNMVEMHSFDAFGSRRNINWTDPTGLLTSLETPRGFTGHEQLDEVGLVHMNGRVYDPVLGRFISADPQVQFASNLQSYNRYSYVHNNPLSYTDPSGFGIFSKLKKKVKKAFNRVAEGVYKWSSLRWQVQFYKNNRYAQMALQFAAVATGNPWVVAGINAGLTKLNGGSWGDVATAGAKSFALFQAGVPAPDTGESGGSSGWGYVIAAMRIGSQSVETGGGDGGGLSDGGSRTFANGATTGAFSYLFNDALHSDNDEDIFQGEEKVFRRTGSSRIEWEGLENVEWREVQIDGVLELFVRRPLPPMSVQMGVEYGFRAYEFQEGVQTFQYRADSSSFGGNVAKTPIGPVHWTDNTVWRPIKGDTTVFTRRRFRACVAQSCN